MIFNKLLYSKPLRALRVKTAPRWLVLVVDMLIVSCSYWMLALSDILSGTASGILDPIGVWLLILTVYFLVTFFSRSYTRIIRLSVIEDLYREFVVVMLATSSLLAINVLVLLVTGETLMRIMHIIIVGIVSFAFLVMERFLAKQLYAHLMQLDTGRKRVIVLGTSINSLILANALKSEINGKYRPVGLLSSKRSKTGCEINGFKVYSYDPETLVDTFVRNGIHALIFNSENIGLMRSGFADFFMKHNLKLLSINDVREFEADETAEEASGGISTHVKEVQIEDLLGRDLIVLNSTLVRSHISHSCVLITGACGSIGSEIVRHVAVYKADKIVLVDQAETPMHDLALEMQKKFPEADVALFIGDVQNRDRMEEAFKTYRPKYVFHAAAYKHVPMMELNPVEAVLTNVMGTRNIADLAVKYGVYKFVMISTDKAVNPSNVMGCTKRLAEIYTQSLFFYLKDQGNGTQFITTRFGNVLGSNGSVIPLFRKQIREGGPVTVTHREVIRYFMTIPEACSLVLEAGCMGRGGEIYIFDMGKPVKIYDLATRMISLAGLRPDIDIKIVEIGLRPGEKLYEELLSDEEAPTKTHNDKIMIAKVRTYDFTTVRGAIATIIKCAAEGRVHDMICHMKEFVPEYHSCNSEFEKIDQELKRCSDKREESIPACDP